MVGGTRAGGGVVVTVSWEGGVWFFLERLLFTVGGTGSDGGEDMTVSFESRVSSWLEELSDLVSEAANKATWWEV